jgi:starvation-inducible DNA-binding protein
MENKKVLKKLLADTYVLYLKLQNFHWNIKGPKFRELHLMFEEQYTEINVAIDEIAERITTLGDVAPGTFKQFLELSTINQNEELPNNTDEMLKELIKAHNIVSETCLNGIKVFEEQNDPVTVDLFTGRASVHQKFNWMFKSILE